MLKTWWNQAPLGASLKVGLKTEDWKITSIKLPFPTQTSRTEARGQKAYSREKTSARRTRSIYQVVGIAAKTGGGDSSCNECRDPSTQPSQPPSFPTGLPGYQQQEVRRLSYRASDQPTGKDLKVLTSGFSPTNRSRNQLTLQGTPLAS